ncbi:MAG: DNA replication/repair protein RecF [Calditrichaeota bacterium]|nr:DNA replication/repair protein RecF [Calditrichota bacterium]
MKLLELRLNHFRNYQDATIPFQEGINILYGPNGAGKTNILEAIYYLAITKSFRTSIDKHLIFSARDMFRIQGLFHTTQGQEIVAHIAYSITRGKHLSVNGQKITRFADYIGDIPVVLLCPSDLSLSQGSPQQRRRFLDVLLSQSSKIYLHHLVQYRRALKQRNLLLQQTAVEDSLLESWEENLIKNGVLLIQKRLEVVEELSHRVQELYQRLSKTGDKVKMVYRSRINPGKGQDLETVYRETLRSHRPMEKELGSTLVGPHRDDLLFLINGKPMKTFASQGEHKTFVIALKLAEYHYLQRQKSETPILLFDDIFGELDADRITQMLNHLGSMGQVFVTTTSRNFFEKVGNALADVHYYYVKEGTISPVEA